jgi:hypothetical protein
VKIGVVQLSAYRQPVKPFLLLITLILLSGLALTPAPQPGTVTIIKHASVKSGQAFEFSSTMTGAKSFSLIDDGTAAHNRLTVKAAPGVYRVTELKLESWVLERAVCDSGDPVDAIQVEPGETVECTFYNLFEIVEPPVYLYFLPIAMR